MADALFRYVALGDSSGVGVGAANDGGYPERIFQRLRREGVRAGFLNLAQSGATTREVANGQVARAASKRPALVTLGVGTNDLWRMVPLSTFRQNVEHIANLLEAAGATVVVSNLVDLSLAPVGALVESFLHVPRAAFLHRVDELNGVVNALAGRPGFTVVNLFDYSRRELAGHPEFFSQDGFHPSAQGYDRWAELMWPAVEAVARAWGQRPS